MPRLGHEGERRLEHVEVAPEVDREQRHEILFGPLGEVGLAGDAGDVDHGIEPAALVDELTEQGTKCYLVGDRGRGRPRRAAGGDDAAGRGLFGHGELLGPVEGDEGVDGHDEPTAAAQLFGDRGADATAAAGHDGHRLAGGHGVPVRTSISKPSKVPASSQCSRTSR